MMAEAVRLPFETKAEFSAWLSGLPGLPPMVRLGLGAGIGLVNEPDFIRYRDLFIELLAALAETERGQRVLAELGFKK